MPRRPPGAKPSKKSKQGFVQRHWNVLLVSAAIAVGAVAYNAVTGAYAGHLISAALTTSDETGGYASAGADVADVDEPTCSIPRLDTLSEAEFRAHYWSGDGDASQGKPFILRNATQGWRRGVFSKAYLASQYGEVEVKVGLSKHIPRASGDGYQHRLLGDYLQSISGGAAGGDGEVASDPTYVFDQNEFFHTHAQALRDEIKLPPFFSVADKTLYLCLGGSRTGVQFHKHAAGWYVQIHGRKRWLLYAPEQMPPLHYPTHGISVIDWVRQTLPKLDASRRPLSCVLEPGDLLYVPETWYHATLNLGESIGVAGQDKEPLTGVQQHWNAGNAQHRQRGPEGGLRHYKKVVELSPNSQEGRYMHGLALTELRRHSEAEHFNRRALKLAPDHSETLNNQGVVMSQQSGRLEEALHFFEAATKFNPLHVQALGNQGRILRALGRGADADEREQAAHKLNSKLRAESL